MSAGFIYPYLCGENETVRRWLKLTVDYLSELYKRPDAFEIGMLSANVDDAVSSHLLKRDSIACFYNPNGVRKISKHLSIKPM